MTAGVTIGRSTVGLHAAAAPKYLLEMCFDSAKSESINLLLSRASRMRHAYKRSKLILFCYRTWKYQNESSKHCKFVVKFIGLETGTFNVTYI